MCGSAKHYDIFSFASSVAHIDMVFVDFY